MNELLKNLADLSTKKITEKVWDEEYNCFGPDKETYVLDPEQFAELIIKECISMCQIDVGNADFDSGRIRCVNNIKDRFGMW